VARLRLSFNETTDSWQNATGVELDTNVDFGGVKGIYYVGVGKKIAEFKPMVDTLVKLGYTVGQDLHGAPYDWRLAPDGWAQPGNFYDRLRRLIEETVERNQAPAHLVTHSLGGPAALGFLATVDAEWKREHLASFVPISPPFGGASMQVLADVSGDNFDVPLLPHDYVKAIQSSVPSGSFLLPTAALPGVLAVAGKTSYTHAELPQFLADLGLHQAKLAYERLTERKLRVDLLPSPGVPMLLLTSGGVSTPRSMKWEEELRPGFDTAPQVLRGDGDGVVPTESLRVALDWAEVVEHLHFANVSHFGMLSTPSVLEALKSHLQPTVVV